MTTACATATARFVETLEADASLADALAEALDAYRTEWNEDPAADATADLIDDAYRAFLPEAHAGIARIVAEAVDPTALIAWLDGRTSDGE
jgi:hypothetical protein